MAATIPQLANELALGKATVTECLRKARLIASRLQLEVTGDWIEKELRGYKSGDTVPPYREVAGELQGLNPYYGWQPVLFEDPKNAEVFSKMPIGSPFATIEADVRNDNSAGYEFGLSSEQKSVFSKALPRRVAIRVVLPPPTPRIIVEAVRELLTDWCLELERAGILGEGLEFSEPEKAAAVAANNQFIIQHSVVGNLVGAASSSTVSSSSVGQIEINALKDLIERIRESLDGLPKEDRPMVSEIADKLALEADQPHPDVGIIGEYLASLRNVAEGAAGNLTAHGILVGVRAIVGA